MNHVKLMLRCAVEGTVYALFLWGLLSILPEPSFMHHHLTDALYWIGTVYAVGLYAGRRDGARERQR